MKKLLALILCVMMFVAVMPTSAFAGMSVQPASIDQTDPAASDRFKSLYDAKKAVDHASDALKSMYGALAADQGVFGTVKAIDGVVTDLSKSLFEGLNDVDLTGFNGGKYDHDNAVNKTKHMFRSYIGNEITHYMLDHASSYTNYNSSGDATGIDPVKYMNSFATAASKAMGSAKAQKNIEAMVYTMAMAKVYNDMKDERDDLRDAIVDWEDGDLKLSEYGWNESFAPLALLDPQNFTKTSVAADGFIDAWINTAP